MSKSEGPGRAKRRRWGLWITVIAIAAAAAGYGYVARPWEARAESVPTETVAAGPVTQVLAVNGRVAAGTSVTIRAAVSAQAMSVRVAVGDEVTAGDVLAVLDTALVDAQVLQAQAALEAQQSRQRQAEAAVDRARALGDNTPRSTLEDAELALAGVANETTRLQAALELAQRQVDQYTIRAPMNGVVLSRGVDPGQLVDPQTQMFVVADISDLVVETDVDELYSSRVSEGLPALLKPVGASVAQEGRVIFAAPTVDTATGGRAIKIAFEAPVTLPVGLTVNANIIVDRVEAALSVPRSAIVTDGADSHVLVIEDGVAVGRPITFNDWPADRVIVTEGLSAGDVVIVDPAAVTAGDRVTAG